MYSGDELQVASGPVVAPTKPPLQPIYRLHAELLEIIFNIYVDRLFNAYDRRGIQHFITYTHVCHTWRAVALSSARLWRLIDFTQPKIADECLVRSKQVPICIMTPYDRNLKTEPFYIGSGRTLRQHAERIRKIDVSLVLNEMRGFFAHLDCALPALSTLSLRLRAESGITDLTFTCAMPNVRVVDLSRIALPWDFCMNLTKLSVGKLSKACSPSVSQILTIMRQCPALESVRLMSIHPVIGAATILQTPIELLHLHTLELDLASDHIILHVLSCISIPSFATISIFTPISSLTSVIPRHTQHLRNLSCNEGSILCLSTTKLEFRRPHGSQTILYVNIREMWEMVLSMLSFVNIFDSLKVVTLKIYGWNSGSIMSALPHSFLAALTCLTTLEVSYVGSESFGGLIQPQETLSPILHSDIICPQLKTVIIGNFGDMADTRRLGSLITWLKQRNEFGVRLHRLELISCEVSQDVIDELRLLVDEMKIGEKS